MSVQRRLVLAVGGVLGLAVAYYLISPLFIDRVVDEELPGAAPTGVPRPSDESAQSVVESASTLEPAATQTMQAAAAEPDRPAEDDMPEEEMAASRVLLQGEIYDLAHQGRGTASVYELEDGSRLLRFEDFAVLNGPELHVWLVTVDPVPNTVGVELNPYVDLGPLKGNIGDQNYELPEGLAEEYLTSVVIWCVPFRVPFNAAALNPP